MEYYDSYLEHHGILGQKWGVRRYQNYDGSYTQAGLKRYDSSKESYEKANNAYKETKKAYKEGKATKADVANKKIERKQAENKMNKDYKHLKQDKLGDQGKQLYANGKTITGNSDFTRTMSTIGGLSLSAAAFNRNGNLDSMLRTYGIDSSSIPLNKVLIGVGTASLAAASAKGVKDNYEAKRLRAYYSHTSKY